MHQIWHETCHKLCYPFVGEQAKRGKTLSLMLRQRGRAWDMIVGCLHPHLISVLPLRDDWSGPASVLLAAIPQLPGLSSSRHHTSTDIRGLGRAIGLIGPTEAVYILRSLSTLRTHIPRMLSAHSIIAVTRKKPPAPPEPTHQCQQHRCSQSEGEAKTCEDANLQKASPLV